MSAGEMGGGKIERAEVLPVLPLKNTVLFPFTATSLSAGRPASLAAIEAALATESKELAVAAQREATIESPAADDLYIFGAKAVIRRMARAPEGAIQLVVQGIERIKIVSFEQTTPYLKALVHLAPLPELMLDEVDKLGRDYRGDPAAALLEILDPEQNKTFRDNYLDLPFDLSKVFFITTANTLDTVPQPLLDRMETLRLSGYSEEEKIVIARRYLIPRQLKESGLTAEKFTITDEALRRVIARYTREAGLRQLERAIGRLARKIALRFAEGNTKSPARSDTAMTGEITLTGLVLPIGGVKEKVLAARRAGIRRVILPKENEKDLRELPDNVRAEMEFIFVERVEDALPEAIPGLAERMKEPKAA